MGVHTKNLDRIIDKLIPKEVLPTILSNSMENKIKELIEKWEHREGWQSKYAASLIIADLSDLLEFKQKNCCGKAGNGETTTIRTEK